MGTGTGRTGVGVGLGLARIGVRSRSSRLIANSAQLIGVGSTSTVGSRTAALNLRRVLKPPPTWQQR